MSFGIFNRILAALARLGMSPDELVEKLEFMAEMKRENK